MAILIVFRCLRYLSGEFLDIDSMTKSASQTLFFLSTVSDFQFQKPLTICYNDALAFSGLKPDETCTSFGGRLCSHVEALNRIVDSRLKTIFSIREKQFLVRRLAVKRNGVAFHVWILRRSKR